MGGSFQRALLCDIRVAAEGTRFRLPEVTHGVIPDTGGVAVLHQIAGPGLVSDMVLTGRVSRPTKPWPTASSAGWCRPMRWMRRPGDGGVDRISIGGDSEAGQMVPEPPLAPPDTDVDG